MLRQSEVDFRKREKEISRKATKVYQSWNKKRKKEKKARQRSKAKQPKIMSPVQSRAIFRKAIRDGDIVRQENCELCNSDIQVEAHHSDYAKPLRVVWLCRSCHIEAHGWINDPWSCAV